MKYFEMQNQEEVTVKVTRSYRPTETFPLVQLCERERSGGESKEMEERRGEEVESREEVEVQNQVVGHAQFASWGAVFSTSYVCYVTS